MGPSDIGDACRPPKGRQHEMFWLRHVGGIVVVLVLIPCDWKEVGITRSPFTPAPTLSFNAEAVHFI